MVRKEQIIKINGILSYLAVTGNDSTCNSTIRSLTSVVFFGWAEMSSKFSVKFGSYFRHKIKHKICVGALSI